MTILVLSLVANSPAVCELITADVGNIEADSRTLPEALARSELLSKSDLVNFRILDGIRSYPAGGLHLRQTEFESGTGVFSPLVLRTENNAPLPAGTVIGPGVAIVVLVTVVQVSPQEGVTHTEVTHIKGTPVDETNALLIEVRSVVVASVVLESANIAEAIGTKLEDEVVHKTKAVAVYVGSMVKGKESTRISLTATTAAIAHVLVLMIGYRRKSIDQGSVQGAEANRNSIPASIDLVYVSPVIVLAGLNTVVSPLNYSEGSLTEAYVDIFNTGAVARIIEVVEVKDVDILTLVESLTSPDGVAFSRSVARPNFADGHSLTAPRAACSVNTLPGVALTIDGAFLGAVSYESVNIKLGVVLVVKILTKRKLSIGIALITETANLVTISTSAKAENLALGERCLSASTEVTVNVSCGSCNRTSSESYASC